MENQEPRMWLRFVYDDGSTSDLEIEKFASIKSSPKNKVKFHVDAGKDGKHLLIVDESVLKVDAHREIVSKITRIDVLRSSDGQSPGEFI